MSTGMNLNVVPNIINGALIADQVGLWMPLAELKERFLSCEIHFIIKELLKLDIN